MMTKKIMKPLLGAVGVTALSFGAMLGITAPAFADAVAPVAPVASVTTASPAGSDTCSAEADATAQATGSTTSTSTAASTTCNLSHGAV